jgi:hypothetical protein
MPFSVSVYAPNDWAWIQRPPDVQAPEFDAWEARANAACRYDAPLGAGGTIHSLWSKLAEDLHLPLIAQIYDGGLEVTGSDLDRLQNELETLVAHWSALDLASEPLVEVWSQGDGGSPVISHVPLREDLLERARSLRTAIDIARDCSGVVSIG